MVAVKLIPLLISWFGIVLVLLRGFSGRRFPVAAAGIAGFALGVVGAFALLRSYPGELSFGIIRGVVAGVFLLLWGIAVAALYRNTMREFHVFQGEKLVNASYYAVIFTFTASIIAGAICTCRLPAPSGNILALLLLVLVAVVLAFAALAAEKMLPAYLTVSQPALMAAVVALLLFSASSLIRLDLFSPLSMKVMKFAHDFVHQFFESMLIPDHLFIRTYLWGYIGLLFGNGVGFWGGMIIWFTPVVLILLAIRFELLPSVAHIRQGAKRRKLLAAAIRERRFRLVVPLLALLVFAAAAYRSSYPSVEYWDPVPVPVMANPAGEIVIPKQGEINLEDGKLHKYLYKQGGKEARFFVLLNPSGQFTVDLDACAICKPDGYGQAEGTVICYYCKTLIPLETVGKPGGCNPVPVPFTVKEDGVHIDGMTIINSWNMTVQATARIKEGGK
ncbi:DUF2318 domain-containing protein [Geobacter sp. AOG1]|uniref:DUF2318 domain-containing protein n=1 Tax=Geobacter sp. AOG1 TaxID=1566346 RepID=UPI001CC75F7C|nr:DUF2318 domain-containing protein [Geobacter sp. AOG1]GFE57813.1 hypothetical protein AOG1_16930 [Geobacter sp. AOG1]